ncbi:hypothetical protein [Rhodococcus opacus]|uniref:hypothetical protein n=1 Tax=Rhodococcus opacus TaxID=37919 RepID=UPI0034D3883C
MAMEPTVDAVVNRLLDNLKNKRSKFDLVSDFAAHVPGQRHSGPARHVDVDDASVPSLWRSSRAVSAVRSFPSTGTVWG